MVGTDVVVVTGAARGIGAATASRFAHDGATVVLVDRAAAELVSVEKSLGGARGDVCSRVVDLANPEAIDELIAWVQDRFARVDVLVSNAAVILPKGLLDATAHEWDLMMAVNVRAPFLLARASVPLLRGHGAIVNVASIAGVEPHLGNGPYSVGKAAVVMLTRALAQELRGSVRVNCVCPGATRTPALQEHADALGVSLTPLEEAGTIIEPEEIADAIAFVARSRSMTGSVVVVDRGALIP